MSSKRLSLFCGHYGSGKTNIAVNYAFRLKAHDDMTVEAEWKGGRCVRHRITPGPAYSGRAKTIVLPDGRRIPYAAEAISEPRNTRKPSKP